LKVDSTNAALLRYSEVETNGTVNITCSEGALRFWFKPVWSSGTGPGSEGRLIEVGTQGSNGWWALHLNTTGTELRFSAETDAVGTNYLSADIGWSSCGWVQIVLNYLNTAHVEGKCIGNGLNLGLRPKSFAAVDRFS
jgi:hypothetical protein